MRAVEWDYLAEGNHHIVLKYVGSVCGSSSEIVFRGMVLRFAKAGSSENHSQQDAFLSTILQPILTPKYIHRAAPTPLPSDFLLEIAKKIEAQRPVGRRAKAVPLSGCTGYLEPDLTMCVSMNSSLPTSLRNADIVPGSTTLCIEIKVKCGLTPCSPIVEDGHFPVKVSHSKYAFTQLVKCAQDRRGVSTPWGAHIREISCYDPADLCSGEFERVFRSCKHLVSSPQNNFIVFVDGQPVYGLKETSVERFQLACLRFMSDGKEDAMCAQSQPVEDLLHVVASILCREDILQRLQLLQALDVIDVLGAVEVLHRLASHFDNDLDQAMALVDEMISSYTPSASAIRIVSPRLSFSDEINEKITRCMRQAESRPNFPTNLECVDSSKGLYDDLSGEDVGINFEAAAKLECKLLADFFLMHVSKSTPDADCARFKQEAKDYISNLNVMECVLLLRLWLIALGASDASVMLSLTRIELTETAVVPQNALQTECAPGILRYNEEEVGRKEFIGTSAFMYSVAATDVGPKPASKILSKAKVEQELCDLARDEISFLLLHHRG